MLLYFVPFLSAGVFGLVSEVARNTTKRNITMRNTTKRNETNTNMTKRNTTRHRQRENYDKM